MKHLRIEVGSFRERLAVTNETRCLESIRFFQKYVLTSFSARFARRGNLERVDGFSRSLGFAISVHDEYEKNITCEFVSLILFSLRVVNWNEEKT